MLNRDPEREAPRSAGRRSRHGVESRDGTSGDVSVLRRGYRWLNLTLIQHGIWPLLIVVWGAPAVQSALIPLPWYWARLGAPVAAAVLAIAFLLQRPGDRAFPEALGVGAARDARDRRWREQALILILGLTIAVALLRLVQGSIEPVLKLVAVGLAEVAAFQLINFAIAGRWATAGIAHALPIGLFGLSWGLQNLFLAAASAEPEQLILAFAGGALLGLAFGTLSFTLRRWPGGFLAAAALQFLLVYLVFGFLGT